MGIFSPWRDNTEKTNPKLEREMEGAGLEEWQKKLVRQGKNNIEDFDEDDTSDEDNYYNEDQD